jgi:membrane protease YdiL (CAAX protease family)
MWGIPYWAWAVGITAGCVAGLLMFEGVAVGLIFGVAIGTVFAVAFHRSRD